MISTVVTRWVSIAAFVSGVDLPDDIVFSGIRETFSLATAISRKSFKTFTIKQEKHGAIKLFAQSKLDRIGDIISQPLQDGGISFSEKY